MNISSSTLIFSNTIWSQLQTLPLDKQEYLLNALKKIINQSDCQNKLKNLTQDNIFSILVKIPCNQVHQIIVTISDYKQDLKIVKFLGFTEQSSESNLNINVELIDNLKIENIKDRENDSQLEAKIINDYFINQVNSQITEIDFQCQDDDFYFYSGDNTTHTLPILLSSEQYKLIEKKSKFPVLLTGNQGTGKTTIAIYQALNQAQIHQQDSQYQILYVTPNQRLTKEVNQTIHNFNKTYVKNLRCQEYQAICRFIGQKYGIIGNNEFLAQRKITFHKFVEQFYQQKKIFTIKPEDLWAEIYKIIKGFSKSINSKTGLISLEDYLGLKNQSTLPANSDFKFVYNLASQYQKWLRTQNYWDELDITQFLLSHMTEHYQGDYNQIYIDEIQELTEIQVQLLLKLLIIKKEQNYLPKIFLIGQTESPFNQNSFSWHKIKKVIIELYHKLPQWAKMRSVIEPISLNHKFIRPQSITNLSAAIVNLGTSTSSLDKEIYTEFSWQVSEDKPLVISGTEIEILGEKNRLAIDGAIIVFNDSEKDKLIKHFSHDDSRILTIEESKGLEFNQVLVWKLLTNLTDLQNQPQVDLQECKNLKYYYLYTCTNLAKEKLYFYDEEVDEFWNFPTINELIEIGYATDLSSLFADSLNSDEKIKQAEIYLNLGVPKAYAIASQLYHQADDVTGAAKVKAIKEEEQGNWGKAGDIWNGLNKFDEAIRCWNEVDKRLWQAKWAVLKAEDWSNRGLYFEKIQDYNLANLCYEKADDFDGKLRCLEANNQWELAGDKCQAINQTTQAEKYYQLADKYYQETKQIKAAIQMWTKLDKWDKVALLWQKAQQWEKAAFCWQKQGELAKAGFCWQKAKKWTEAQKCWRELEKWTELAQCYEEEGKWELAAQTWQKQGETEKAGFCYQKGNRWEDAEKIWRQLEYWGLVAVALQQQQKWELAAKAWEKANPSEQQALCYEQLQKWDKAEQCWLQAKNWVRSIIACEKQGKWQEAAESWENLAEWEKSAKAWLKIEEWEKAAECYDLGEMWQESEKLWRQLGDDSRLANSLAQQGKYQESAQIWETMADWQQAGKAWRNQGEMEKAGECYEKGEYWREAEECWREVENWEKVDLACAKQGKWQKAAHDWLIKNQLDKAALCYENCQDWERAAKYWKKSYNWGKYAEVCQQLQQWEEAAQAYLRINNNENTEKAAWCFEKLQNWDKAADCWRKIWKWEKLALICEQQEKWEEAGKAWLLMNEAERAADCYERVNNWEKAEECWRKLENWEKLATVCESQSKWEESAQLWNFLGQWEKAANACLQMDDVETAIKYYEKGELWDKAEEYRQKLAS